MTIPTVAPAAVEHPPRGAAAEGSYLPVDGAFPPSVASTGSPAGVGRGSSIPPVDEQPPVAPDPAGPPTLQDLLDAVVTTTLRQGGASERAQIAALLCEHGLDTEFVVCERCGTRAIPVMRFLFGHFVKAERAYLDRVAATYGPNAALHGVGDVRPATFGEYLVARAAMADTALAGIAEAGASWRTGSGR